MTREELINLHLEVRQTHLPMYTITVNPSDFPGKHVARLTIATSDVVIGPVIKVADTLDEVREFLAPLGLFCQPRDVNDDPVIVETWF